MINDLYFSDTICNKPTIELSWTKYNMMRYCWSKNYNSQLLLNDPLFSSNPTSEMYVNNNEDPVIESIPYFGVKEKKLSK